MKRKPNEYWKGRENWFIRMYFYFHNGMNLAGEFRYLIAGVIALYVLLKVDKPILMVAMFLIAIPILLALGYYNVHRMAKVNEWLSTKYSTHFALKNFELNQKSVKILTNIEKQLFNKKKKNGK